MRSVYATALLGAVLCGPAHAQVSVGDSAHGYVIATEFCAQCHIVTDPQTPPLTLGVPSFFDVANNPATSVLSLRAFLNTPHERMPDYLINRTDIDDIIAYILGLRGRDRRLPDKPPAVDDRPKPTPTRGSP